MIVFSTEQMAFIGSQLFLFVTNNAEMQLEDICVFFFFPISINSTQSPCEDTVGEDGNLARFSAYHH